jgi:hypothetical protein
MKRTVLWALCLLILGTQIVGCSSLDTYIKGNELSYIKDKLHLGMNKTEVKERFGRSYTNVLNSVEGNEIWRYDLVSDKDYIVASETGKDAFDRSGLLTRKLSSQLFVGWTNDNVVKDIELYYVVDGKIHEYRSVK